MSDSMLSIRRFPFACTFLLAGMLVADLAAAASDSAGDEGGLAEVVVTAEKVKSTIQDTPISISALSGSQLETAGITSVQEIARTVPGISVRSAGPGLTEYDARGLASNGGAAPTVGFYLDEIPLSPPALSQSGKVVIDPGIYDVERVEVLRGPQGTLYGSGSMGGTVKIVTAQPKLGEYEGSAQVMGSETQGGGGNYSGNLMLNIPLGDVLALRLVAGDVYRSGWINLITVNVGRTRPRRCSTRISPRHSCSSRSMTPPLRATPRGPTTSGNGTDGRRCSSSRAKTFRQRCL